MTSAVHYSSNTNEWATPQALFVALDAEFHFTLDPCATPATAKCRRYYTEQEDGLAHSWKGEVVFMNPPYGRAIAAWVQKAYEEAQAGAVVVALIPARTDTRYWHASCMRAAEIRFVVGRVKFEHVSRNQTFCAPFPSAIVVFRAGNHRPQVSSYTLPEK